MVLSLILGVALQTGDEAKALIVAVAKQYAGLESFSATVVHHDDSGLFPGDYTQELRWRKPNRFELKVTKESNYTAASGAPGMKAPDFYSDGSAILSIWPDKHRTTSALAIAENTSPGWEVSGGPIVGWLQSTPMSKVILDPPSSIKVEYEKGKTGKWQGEKVQEVVMTWTGGGQTVPIHFFFTPDGQSLYGYSFQSQGRVGWCVYKDQKRNPKLPDDLGKHPK